jgi:hypothetical protein
MQQDFFVNVATGFIGTPYNRSSNCGQKHTDSAEELTMVGPIGLPEAYDTMPLMASLWAVDVPCMRRCFKLA